MDAGFRAAGFNLLWANDSDPYACRTYEDNLGDHIVCGDVLEADIPQGLSPDVVVGGPPCQGFSVIGKMDRSDPRSRHVFNLIDVADAAGARCFVLENVKALATSPRWADVREALIEHATDHGFVAKLFVLNAADYGVPQTRERMFLVGIRDQVPEAPPPTTAEARPTVREALDDLPPFGSPGNNSVVKAKVVPAADPIMRPTAFMGSLLFNGSGRPLHLNSPAKTLPASMGGNATPILDQDELEHGKEPWVVEYHRRLTNGGRPLKRAPRRLRRITVEEAAALQSFPSGWTFAGPQVAQLRQIGNAVPPLLALHVARAVSDALGHPASTASDSPALIAA